MTRKTILSMAAGLLVAAATPAWGQADLNDLEMAHAAVTASDIDIAYAHLALALSTDAAVRNFAQRMIDDHGTINGRVYALAKKLGVTAQDNALSRSLRADARGIVDELSGLRGRAFDRRYLENELAYHEVVNGAVANAFIPNARNAEVRKLFEEALIVFRGHEEHVRQLTMLAEGS